MIGIFDSGVGGLSVLAEIRRELPLADLLYLADQGRAPYGVRTLDEVAGMTEQATLWLLDRGATRREPSPATPHRQPPSMRCAPATPISQSWGWSRR